MGEEKGDGGEGGGHLPDVCAHSCRLRTTGLEAVGDSESAVPPVRAPILVKQNWTHKEANASICLSVCSTLRLVGITASQ